MLAILKGHSRSVYIYDVRQVNYQAEGKLTKACSIRYCSLDAQTCLLFPRCVFASRNPGPDSWPRLRPYKGCAVLMSIALMRLLALVIAAPL